MGCGASKPGAAMSEDKRGSMLQKLGIGDNNASGSMRTLRKAAGIVGVMDFGGNREGHSHNQDRFVICPKLAGGLFLIGVFDGHGKEGGSESAESAARNLPDYVGKFMLEAPEKRDVRHILTRSFEVHQEDAAAAYEKEVMGPVLEAKKKIEDETGVELPTLYPHEGGTTATVCVVDGPLLYTAWVGDSRAIIARAGGSPSKGGIKPTAVPLSVDHDVDNVAEQKRVADCGGTVFGRYFAVKDADGILQLSRSLGDVGFHRGNVVSATPEISLHRLNRRDMFIIVATDGLWTMFTNEEAAAFVHARLMALDYRSDPTDEKVLHVTKELEEQAHERAVQRGKKKDDVGIVIVTFSPYWVRDETDLDDDPDEDDGMESGFALPGQSSGAAGSTADAAPAVEASSASTTTAAAEGGGAAAAAAMTSA